MKNNMQEQETENPVKREKNHEEKKYQFMKEQIRPQGKHRIRRLARFGGMVLGMLVLFCVISVLTFSIMRKYLPVESLGTEVIYCTPQPEKGPDVVQGGTQLSTGDGKTLLEEYSAMSQKLVGMGDTVKGALVQLQFAADDSSLCSVIFQKSSQGVYILTTDAIPQQAERAQAIFEDGSQAEVKLVGQNATVGIAVYRAGLSDLTEQMQEEVVTLFADDSMIATGMPVLAIGKPNGVLYSVHAGVITNRQLSVPITDDELRLCTINVPYCKEGTGYILDIYGRMIGVMTTAYTDVTGTSDAAFLTAGSLQSYIDSIVRREHMAYLGVRGSAVNEQEAEKFQLEQGVYVSAVESASPAYRGGMRVADVITEIAGKRVTTVVEMREEIQHFAKGEEIQITVLRKAATGSDSKKKKLRITLG